uniref:DEP domain-containing protein n=1 Tax=Kalanchoe fedtschenkoi TaxID=63787 RepID=A0A7N0TU66_KALFE
MSSVESLLKMNRPDVSDFSCVDLDQPKESAQGQIDNAPAAPSQAVESDGEGEVAMAKGGGQSINSVAAGFVHPHAQLPKPEAPRGFIEDGDQINRSVSFTENLSVDVPAIGKFIRETSSNFSTALVKSLSSTFKDNNARYAPNVTEINLSGLKVIVKSNESESESDRAEDSIFSQVKGRISFFSRSNCRDSTAVRTFFREKGLKVVEINIDVFPKREKELIQRTGSSSVPQIFVNEKLLGGLVVLNSLRNSGQFDYRMREMLMRKCPDDAPALPLYGFDDEEEDSKDEMIGIVRILRHRLPIQDRLMKMKIVKNCFAGSELVEVIIHHLNCGRNKAVEIGKIAARKHFIHHIFGENEFEDGNHFYRFLEHEPYIPRCYNFRGSNDSEPNPAITVGQRLAKIMSAIMESYASEDRRHVDYTSISNSEEFRRYVNLVQDLHRVDIQPLSLDEKLAFFLNLYNMMVIHAVIRIGHPGGLIDRRLFFSDFMYLVGGHSFSLSEIENGILRNNRKPPYSLTRHFSSGDHRLQLALPKVNVLVHFGLCNGTKSSPTVRFFSAQTVQSELRVAAREFFQCGGIEINLAKRTVHLSRIIKWFSADFGSDKEILKWILNFLDASKAGLLTHLMNDGESVRISYQNYDWSPNS